MKKSEYTYADAAAKILKKFKPMVDKGDAMATEAMNKQLSALKAQQEQERQKILAKQKPQMNRQMPIGDMSQQGMPMAAFGGDFGIPPGIKDMDYYTITSPYNKEPMMFDDSRQKNPTVQSITNPRYIPTYGNSFKQRVGPYSMLAPAGEIPRIANSMMFTNPNNEEYTSGNTKFLSNEDFRNTLPVSRITPKGINTSVNNNMPNNFDNTLGNYNIASPNKSVDNQLPTKSSLFSPYQWGTLGANAAGALGQIGPMIAASKVKMPTSTNVQTPTYTPETGDEERKAIERMYLNVSRDPNMSPNAKLAANNKAFINTGEALGKYGEGLANLNIRGKAAHDALGTDVAFKNESNRLATEELGAKKKLSDLSNVSSLIGNLGSVTANTFKDAQSEQMNLVSLAAMAPAGRGIQKLGNDYYETYNPEGTNLKMIKGVTNGKTYYYDGTTPIDEATFTKKLGGKSLYNNTANPTPTKGKGGFLTDFYNMKQYAR